MNSKQYVIVQTVFNYLNKQSDLFLLNDIKTNLANQEFISELEKFRETKKWMTYENKVFLIKDIENNHLINIIGHLSKIQSYGLNFEFMMIHEFFYRGLSESDLRNFQIPHINSEGKKVLMSYDDKNPYLTVEVI